MSETAAQYVALLYSIVLTEGRRVGMADLRDMAVQLGLGNPRTLVAAGNLIFAARAGSVADFEALLEPAFARRFGRSIDIIVRGAPDWRRLVANNPYPEAARAEPAEVAVRVMRKPLTPTVVTALEAYRSGDERMALVYGDLLVHFPGGFAGSRLAAAIKPHRAGGVGTFRNWNTVRGLGEMLET